MPQSGQATRTLGVFTRIMFSSATTATTIGAPSGTFSHLRANDSEPTPKGVGFLLSPHASARPPPPARHVWRHLEPDSPEGKEKPSGLRSQKPDAQRKNQKKPQKTRVSTRESPKKLEKNLTFGKLLLYCSTFYRKTDFSPALARFFARSLPLRRSFLAARCAVPYR